MLNKFDYKNDANEFVYYGVIDGKKFDFYRYKEYAIKCVNLILRNYDINIYCYEYYYENYKGFSTWFDYNYDEIEEIWKHTKSRDLLECKLKHTMINLYLIAQPIFICLCDWPNDADFLKKYFANQTYGIISEFDPIIRDVDDYNKEEWEHSIISLGEKVKQKYGVILDW